MPLLAEKNFFSFHMATHQQNPFFFFFFFTPSSPLFLKILHMEKSYKGTEAVTIIYTPCKAFSSRALSVSFHSCGRPSIEANILTIRSISVSIHRLYSLPHFFFFWLDIYRSVCLDCCRRINSYLAYGSSESTDRQRQRVFFSGRYRQYYCNI